MKRVTLILFLLGLASSPLAPLFAQAPSEPDELDELIALASESIPQPHLNQIVAKPDGTLRASDTVGPVVMANMPVNQALALLQTLSGRIILPQGDLPGNARLHFNSVGTLRRDEAIFAIENLLAMNGVNLIALDDRFIRAVPTSQAMRKAPPLLSDQPLDEMASERYFARIFRTRYLPSNDVFRSLQPLLSPGAQSGIVNFARSNSLLIVDTLSNLQLIEKVLLDIDQPTTVRNEVYFFPVKNVSAQQVRNILNTLRSSTHSDVLGDSNFWVDTRTNQLVVATNQAHVAFIQEIIDRMDKEVTPLTTSEVIPIKRSGNIQTIFSIINNLINNQRRVFTSQGFVNQDQIRRDGPRLRRDEGDFPDMELLEAFFNEEGPITSNTPLPEFSTADAEPMMDAGMPQLQFSQYAAVFLDPQSSSIVAYGTPADIERIRKLVTELDVERAPLTTSRVFYLEFADAQSLAQVVTTLISRQQSVFRQQGLRLRDSLDFGEGQGGRDAGAAALPLDGGGFDFSPYVAVVAERRANALLVFGTSTDIDKIAKLVKETDVEVAPITSSRVFRLRYAQANNLASILQQIVTGQQRALQQQAATRRSVRLGDTETVSVGEGDQALQFSPYISIVPETRGNAIIVYGTRSDIQQIQTIIEDTDIEVAPFTTSRVFKIQHATATQVVQTIQPLILSQLRVREQESTLRRVFTPGDAELGANGGPIDSQANRAVTTSLTTDTYGAPRDYDEGLQFSPYVSLVADSRSNTVVAYGTDFDLSQISVLIAQIDEVLPQVRIEVIIAEVSLTGNQVSGLSEFGINYRQPFDPANPGIGDIGVTGQTDRLTESGSSPRPLEFNFTLQRFSFEAIFRTAQENRNVRILSAPTIVTTHNQEASINVGQARPIITSSTSSALSSDLTTRSTVEYRDIGIELRVLPLIGSNKVIQMSIEQIVETVVDTQTIDGNIQPIIGTRRATSFISLRDQEVIVLGGLQSVESTDRDGKVWLLGDIPILGELFRPKGQNQTVRELIIFIRPIVVESTDIASLMGTEAIERSAVGTEVQYFMDEGRFPQQEALLRYNIQQDEEILAPTPNPRRGPRR